MSLDAVSLTEAIVSAFEKEWAAAKGSPLPAVGKEDRRLMFAAVARGILEYLEAHQNEFFNTITFEEPPGQTVTRKVTEVDLNISI